MYDDVATERYLCAGCACKRKKGWLQLDLIAKVLGYQRVGQEFEEA